MRIIDVLLIEDDPADAELVREAFKGFAVQTELIVFHDGEKALEALRAKARPLRPDLILLDLNLPRMDGRAVLRELKRDRNLKQIPVIILTTSSADVEVLQSYLDGANCFLTKPVGIDELFRMARLIERFWLRLATLPGGEPAPGRRS